MPEMVWSDLPRPGSGRTWERWEAFVAIARRDLAAARLAEGHHDAVAILDELGVGRPDGCLGVWAAEPARTLATREREGWRLRGTKAWCSGASSLDHALVTATASDGPRLFLVAASAPGIVPVPGSWPSIGMADTDSQTVEIDVAVPDEAAIGPPGAYTGRAGFWHGAAGVAACWYGGAVEVAERLGVAAAERPTPHRHAAVGATVADLDAAGALLRATAAAIDDEPAAVEPARRRALAVRAVVWSAGRRLLDAVEDALGARPLCLDPAFGRAWLDLRTYLAQHHGAADLEELGKAAIGDEVRP